MRQRNRGLDGMRALAVLAVLLFHADVRWARGGYLGVDAFFVLSGFLITRLLLVEHDHLGRIDLPRFWARRMRRLLPALLLLVAVVATVMAFAGAPDDFRLDAAAALAYVANWRFMVTGAGYFAQDATPSVLQHTWSLAIEEQFYVFWPLVLAGVLRLRQSRRAVLTIALLGAAGSATLMAAMAGTAEPNRLYYGTDTRGQSLLLGAALAAALATPTAARFASARAGRVALHAVAMIGLVATALLWWRLDSASPLLYRGGFALAALATAAVIASVALVPRGVIGRVLGIEPLRLLGRISYGVYLWHWPIQLSFTHARTGLSGPALIVGRMIATIAVAAASFALVESPVRRTVRVSRTTIVAFATATTLLAGVLAAAFVPRPTGEIVVAATLVTTTTTSTSTTIPAATVAPTATSTTVLLKGVPATRRPAPPPPTPTRTAAVFGDSVAMSEAQGLAPVAGRYGLHVIDDAILGCGVASSGDYQLSGTTRGLAGECGWADTWTASLARDHPDVVVVQLGRHEVLNRVYNGAWTDITDPAYREYLAGEIDKAITIVSSQGARVALLTAPYYRRPERPDGGQWPENDPARVNLINALLRNAAGAHPGVVTLIDLGGRTNPGGHYASTVAGVSMRKDGVHYSAAACAWFAPWLLPQVYALGSAP